MAHRHMVTWLRRVLLAVAVLSLGFVAWNWLDANVYQRLQERRLNDAIHGKTFGQVRAPEAPRAAATRREMSKSGLIGRIEIPRLGVSAIVAEGTSSRVLRRAVGHLSDTALPGEPGNVALAGHRDSFFRGLGNVMPGDRVRITTPDGVLEYSVISHHVVDPGDLEVLESTSTPTLTLITCFPFNYIGPAPGRFVVRARQVDSAPDPSSTPAVRTAGSCFIASRPEAPAHPSDASLLRDADAGSSPRTTTSHSAK